MSRLNTVGADRFTSGGTGGAPPPLVPASDNEEEMPFHLKPLDVFEEENSRHLSLATGWRKRKR